MFGYFSSAAPIERPILVSLVLGRMRLPSWGKVERVRLRSHAVVSAGYDEAAAELELEFSSGHVYRYAGVAPSVFAWLLRTKNKGGFVRRMVQGRYPESAVKPSRALAATPTDQSLEETLRASLALLSKPPA